MIQKIVLSVLLVFSLASCMQKSDDAVVQAITTANTATTDSSSDIDVTTDGSFGSFTSTDYFKLTDVTTFDDSSTVKKYVLHKTGQNNSTADCQISANTIKLVREAVDDYYETNGSYPTNAQLAAALSNTADYSSIDISCYLDADELELYNTGFKLELDMPANLCAWVDYKPYSFFRYQPGKSYPGLPAGASPDTAVFADFTYSTYSPHADGCTMPDGLSDSPELLDSAAFNSAFSFNYTTTDPEYLCDEGYMHYKQVVCGYTTNADGENICACGKDDGDTGKKTTWTPSIKHSQGEYHNCIAGPAKDHDAMITSPITGYPLYDRQKAITGEPFEFSVASPVSKDYKSNLYVSNFSIPFNDGGSAYVYNTIGLKDFTTVGDPYPVINNAFVGDPRRAAMNPFYEFNCLNSAYENLARIRVYVRSWSVAPRKNFTGVYSGKNDITLIAPYNLKSSRVELGPDGDFFGILSDIGSWDDQGRCAINIDDENLCRATFQAVWNKDLAGNKCLVPYFNKAQCIMYNDPDFIANCQTGVPGGGCDHISAVPATYGEIIDPDNDTWFPIKFDTTLTTNLVAGSMRSPITGAANNAKNRLEKAGAFASLDVANKSYMVWVLGGTNSILGLHMVKAKISDDIIELYSNVGAGVGAVDYRFFVYQEGFMFPGDNL